MKKLKAIEDFYAEQEFRNIFFKEQEINHPALTAILHTFKYLIDQNSLNPEICTTLDKTEEELIQFVLDPGSLDLQTISKLESFIGETLIKIKC